MTPPQFITIPNVAATLVVSRETVRRMVLAGQFPSAIKVGRDWRVPQSDLDAYIQRNRLAPQRRLQLAEGT
jgi:excisionase family DNA binding protein